MNEELKLHPDCVSCAYLKNESPCEYSGVCGFKHILWTPKDEKHDLVNHPDHYISETGLEVIDVIEAFTFNLKGIEATDTGNIIKYICRWKHKNGLQDLKKAQWYINHLIKHVENLEKENK